MFFQPWESGFEAWVLKRSWVVLLLLFFTINPAFSETMPMTETIQEVKARHQDQLMALPGVISVGIGRDERGNPAIILGLDAKQSASTKKIPEMLDGDPVVTRDMGPVMAQ
jgi:hypothetical protein